MARVALVWTSRRENRSFRLKHCADAGWVRWYQCRVLWHGHCPCPGPENDDFVDTFMSCSGKRLPIYAFFTAAFSRKHGALVMIALYFGGILIGILMALFMRGTLFQGEAVPFVMELPNYRMPGAKMLDICSGTRQRIFCSGPLPLFSWQRW